MLQGLCTRLEVSYPFLRPMASAAQQRLLKHSRQQLLDNDASPPTVPRTPKTLATPPSRHAAAPPPSQRGVASPRPSASASASTPQRLLSPLLSAVGRSSVLRASASAGPQQHAQQLLSALASTGELLGAQACLVVRGKTVVDASAGRMGTVDARPVRPDTLFQLFQAGAPLLSAMVLQAVARGDLSLDDPVSKAWPAFGAPALSVGGLLAHRSGLATCIPAGTRLKHLLEPLPMAEWVAAAAAAAGTAEREQRAVASGNVAGVRGGAEFEGAPWGWTVAGLLHTVAPEVASAGSGGGLHGGGGGSSGGGGGGGGGGGSGGGGGGGGGGSRGGGSSGGGSGSGGCSGGGGGSSCSSGGGSGEWSLQALLEQRVTAPLGIEEELRLSLTPSMSSERAARFTTSQMMRELGLEISDMMGATASAPPPVTAAPEEAAGGAGAPKVKALRAAGSDDAPDVYEQSAGDGAQWERFQGAQQLPNPATPSPSPSPSPSPNSDPDPNPNPNPNQARSSCRTQPHSTPRSCAPRACPASPLMAPHARSRASMPRWPAVPSLLAAPSLPPPPPPLPRYSCRTPCSPTRRGQHRVAYSTVRPRPGASAAFRRGRWWTPRGARFRSSATWAWAASLGSPCPAPASRSPLRSRSSRCAARQHGAWSSCCFASAAFGSSRASLPRTSEENNVRASAHGRRCVCSHVACD